MGRTAAVIALLFASSTDAITLNQLANVYRQVYQRPADGLLVELGDEPAKNATAKAFHQDEPAANATAKVYAQGAPEEEKKDAKKDEEKKDAKKDEEKKDAKKDEKADAAAKERHRQGLPSGR